MSRVKPLSFKSKWIVVTGASSGLGKEMARVLAREHGANLVLVARREPLLHELRDELVKHDVEVRTITADLSDEDEVRRLFQEATEVPLYGAILNAGVTHFGPYDELDWEGFRRMQTLNNTSVVLLSTLLLPYLEERAEEGGLMIVSSMAGLNPVPYQTAYSATKAFLVNFGCGLHHEMLSRGVSVTTFAPGGIATEMTEGDRFDKLRGWLMPVEPCAREAVAAFAKRRYLVVPGWSMRWASRLSRLLPQRFFVSRVAAQYRDSLEG